MSAVTPEYGTLKGRIDVAAGWYHRLVLLHMTGDQRPAAGLQTLANGLQIPYVNVSLALSEALLPFARSERPAHVGPELESLISTNSSPCVFLDKIEVLFQPELHVDVLTRLRQLSRNRTLVVVWPGEWSSGTLTYASREHPEYFEERGVEPLSVITLSPAGNPLP